MGLGGGSSSSTQIETVKAAPPSVSSLPSKTEYAYAAPVEADGLVQIKERKRADDLRISSLRSVGSGVVIPVKQKAGIQA